MRVLLLDTAAKTHNSYIPLAITDALGRHPLVEKVVQADYSNAVALFTSNQCNAFIALGGAGGDFAIIARLCAMAEFSALWTTEDPYELEENIRISKVFDTVFTNDLSCLPAFGEQAYHLPLAGSLLFHDIEAVQDDADFLYDICFVGTAWPNRVKTINRILERAQRPLKMKIALPANSYLPPVILNDPSLYTNWRVPNPDLAQIANRSRVTLNLERKFSGSRPDQANGSTPPPRLFENALAGAFQISLGGGSEAKRYFTPETEIAFCYNEEELLQRIDWALDHPEARIGMAQAARRRAQAEHLYDHRVSKIIEILSKKNRNSVKNSSTNDSKSRRKRILLVTHNIQGNQPGGGVEAYQHQIAAVASEFDVYLLVPKIEDGRAVYLFISFSTGEQQQYTAPHLIDTSVLHDAAHERIFERIILENNIDLIHYQHLLGMPLSFPIISHACGIPSLFTAHDFYLVCTRFNLLDYRGHFCNIAERSPTECSICLSATGLPAGASQQRRRNFINRMLEAIDFIVVNSPYTLNFLRSIYPQIGREKIRIIEMLTPDSSYSHLAAPPILDTSRKKRLKVAILGNFTWAKGADAIIRVMNTLRNEPFDFLVLGTIQESALEQGLRVLELPNLTILGGYTPRDIPKLLADVDLSLHLSKWPETYMISLNEALMSGVVPIISDLGAPAERIDEGLNGFKVAPDDVGRVCDILRDLYQDQDRLKRMREVALAHHIVKPAEHTHALFDLYNELIRGQPVAPISVPIDTHRDYQLSTTNCGIRTSTPRWTEEGMGWDSAQPEYRSNQPVTRSDMWRNFPARFAHLRREHITPEQKPYVSLFLDAIEVDSRSTEDRRIHVSKRLGLSGWAFVPEYGRTLDYILHIKGAMQEFYLMEPPIERSDAVMTLNDQNASTSGFSFNIDFTVLDQGVYNINLLQVYDGVVIDLGNIGMLIANRCEFPESDLHRQGAVQHHEDSIATKIVSGGSVITKIYCDIHLGEMFINLEGWAAVKEDYKVLPVIDAGYKFRDQAINWFRGARTHGPRELSEQDPLFNFSGFRSSVAFEKLQPGLHRILVAQADQDERYIHETGVAIWAAVDHIVTMDTAFEVLGPVDPIVDPGDESETHSNLEIFETDLESGENHTQVRAGSHLYLQGWAYIPSAGRALTLTLHLLGSDRSLRASLPVLNRLDVANSLGVEEAEYSGFKVLLPLNTLEPGTYRLCLSYRSKTKTRLIDFHRSITVLEEPRAEAIA